MGNTNINKDVTPRHPAERFAPATGAFDWIGERPAAEPFGAPSGLRRAISALRGSTADRRRGLRA
jgi:hypothetical protein